MCHLDISVAMHDPKVNTAHANCDLDIADCCVIHFELLDEDLTIIQVVFSTVLQEI